MNTPESTVARDIREFTEHIDPHAAIRPQSPDVQEAVIELARALNVDIVLVPKVSEQWTVQFQDEELSSSTFVSKVLADEYAEEMNSLVTSSPDHPEPERFKPARLLRRTVARPSSWESAPGCEYGADLEPGTIISESLVEEDNHLL